MKRVIHYILTLFVILSSCAGPASELESFNVEVYSPEYAQGFSILGAEGMESTIVRVTNPGLSP